MQFFILVLVQLATPRR